MNLGLRACCVALIIGALWPLQALSDDVLDALDLSGQVKEEKCPVNAYGRRSTFCRYSLLYPPFVCISSGNRGASYPSHVLISR